MMGLGYWAKPEVVGIAVLGASEGENNSILLF